jgi:TonB-linked SusC/RagA family outer membrane protein
MKLTCLLLICGFLQARSAAYSQEKITLSVEGVSVKDALRAIQQQTTYQLIYSDDILPQKNKVSISVKDEGIATVMSHALAGTHLTYKVLEGRLIVLMPRGGTMVKVSGTVKNAKGEPLIGVTVKVKGGSGGTATQANGAFSLEAPDSATLVFSYVGYEQKEVALHGQTTLEITLKEAASSLNEVVVVGYGTQKKSDLTGSIATVNFDSVLANRPITNASQALGGKVTGLWVSQNSGKPGSDGAQLSVRGWGTLNNNAPLVLIDGVEGSINEVNPNDIASVSVLKDAASAAIYGSRAANGVILITLKSGSYNQKPKVSLASYVGVQSLGRRYDIIDNSVTYMNLWNQALVNQGGDKLFPDSVINGFKNNRDPYKYPNTNFYDYVFKKAPVTDHNLSVRGGSKDTKYYMSFNYLDQEGIMLHTNSKRYGLTLNLESRINKWFRLGGRINGMRKVSEEPYDIGRVLYIFANGAYPFTAPYTRDGSFGAPEAISNGAPIVGNRNPLIETANGQTRYENNFLKMNAYAQIDFTDYLSLKTNLSIQYNHNLEDRYNQLLYGYTSTGIQAINLDYVTTLEASRTGNDSYYNTWYNTLDFDRTFGDIHRVSATLGMQVENTVLKNDFARRTDPPKEGLTQVDAGTSGIQANGNLNKLRMLSYFGRLDYTLANKYLLEVNFRADASSRFAEGHRWGYFPGVSAAWKLGQEKFIRDLDVFSHLKVRASWGELGNENINGYWPYLTVIDQSNALSYNYGGALAPGAAVTALANGVISWETATTKDVGLDFGFLDDRLTGSVDLFHKVTSNIIVQLPIPLVMGGVTAPYENVGEMLNKGLEINLNYARGASGREEFGYRLGVNLTYVDNEVTRFRGGKSPDQLYLIREGYSYKELYGLKAIGIFKSDEEADKYMYANGYSPKAGDIKYEDVNGDGKIGFEDKMALGNTIPKFTYGFNLGFSYKGFDLSILMKGIAGVYAYTSNAWTQPLGISGGTITKRWKNAWTPDNTQTDIPAIKVNNTWNNQESSFWVSDISFLKAENVQLGYSFPASLTSRLGLSKLYVYLNGQNLFSVVNKDYEGFDPERNTFNSGDNFYPIPRILSFGINVDF